MSLNFIEELTGTSSRALSSPVACDTSQEGREDLSRPTDVLRVRGHTGALDISSRSLHRTQMAGKSFYSKGFLSSEALAKYSRPKSDYSPTGTNLQNIPLKRSLYTERTQDTRSLGSSSHNELSQTHSLPHISAELEHHSKQSPAVGSKSSSDASLSRGYRMHYPLVAGHGMQVTGSVKTENIGDDAFYKANSQFHTTERTLPTFPNDSQFEGSQPHKDNRFFVGTGLENTEDDISARVVKGFSDLRLAKLEVEEQRRETTRLLVLVDTLKSEKSGLANQLVKIKEVTKTTVNQYSNKLADLQSSFDHLHLQSREYFSFASQARSSLPDVAELKLTVKESLDRLQEYFDGDGNLVKSLEAKELYAELELERNSARQANDLLRDKLTDLSSQLVEAQDRVQSLEQLHIRDLNVLASSTEDLARTNSVISEGAKAAQTLQNELFNALNANAQSKREITALEDTVEQLRQKNCEQEQMASGFQTLQKENSQLQVLLNDRNCCLADLRAVKDEHLTSLGIIDQQKTELNALKTGMQDKEREIEKLGLRCARLETENEIVMANVTSLRDEAETQRNRDQSVQTRLITETTTLEQHVKTLQVELDACRSSSEEWKHRSQQTQTHYQVLQERFEDQSTTLRLNRDATGDLQERLLTAERKFASSLEAETGKLKREVEVLRERLFFLQQITDEAKAEVQKHQEEVAAIRSEGERRIREEQDKLHTRLAESQEKAFRAEKDLAQAQTTAKDLRQRIDEFQTQYAELKQQSDDALSSSKSRPSEADELRVQLLSLKSENSLLKRKAETINQRYKNSDLCDDEKAFVDAVLEESENLYGKTLAEKQNELRRRENMIASLESKIVSLEKSLARHLKTEARTQVSRLQGDYSILNLAGFASSEPDILRQGSLSLKEDERHDSPLDVTADNADQNSALMKPCAPGPTSRILLSSYRSPQLLHVQGSSCNAIFTRLASDASHSPADLNDYKENTPVLLGKRRRQSSQKEDDSGDKRRPKTRLKARARNVEPKRVERKAPEQAPKVRTRRVPK